MTFYPLDPKPDPLVKGTDPRNRIRTQMSRIRNTAKKKTKSNEKDSSPPPPPPTFVQLSTI